MSKEPVQHRLNDCTTKELVIGMLEVWDPIMENICIREYNRRSKRKESHPEEYLEEWEGTEMLATLEGGGHTMLGMTVNELHKDEAVHLGPIFIFPREAQRFGIYRVWFYDKVWLSNTCYSVETFMLGFNRGMPYIDRSDSLWDTEVIRGMLPDM